MPAPRPPRAPAGMRPQLDYQRGLEDGRAGAMRAHGTAYYHQGYDDGLDLYDADHAD